MQPKTRQLKLLRPCRHIQPCQRPGGLVPAVVIFVEAACAPMVNPPGHCNINRARGASICPATRRKSTSLRPRVTRSATFNSKAYRPADPALLTRLGCRPLYLLTATAADPDVPRAGGSSRLIWYRGKSKVNRTTVTIPDPTAAHMRRGTVRQSQKRSRQHWFEFYQRRQGRSVRQAAAIALRVDFRLAMAPEAACHDRPEPTGRREHHDEFAIRAGAAILAGTLIGW